jgi:mxaA protein
MRLPVIARRLRHLASVTALTTVLLASMAQAASPSASSAKDASPGLATIQEPRAFGHVIGDVLTQRILLQSGSEDMGTVAMPSVGRAGVWFERRNPRIETDSDGRRWMAIDYQITNAPPTLTQIALPALTLASSTSGLTLQVPEWPVSVAPLTPKTAFASGDLQSLRPDRLAPALATAPLRRQLAFALGLFALTLLVWLGWWQWRNQREAARLPFARAWRQMRRPSTPDVDKEAHAWLCLHRALNETAGHVVHAGALPGLVARAPYLQPLQPQLERFYQHSGERFFTARANDADASFPLHELCRELYRAERRQQR